MVIIIITELGVHDLFKEVKMNVLKSGITEVFMVSSK